MTTNPDKTLLRWHSRRGWSLHGKLNFKRVPKLARETSFMLRNEAPDHINLKDVEWTDSAGIALLVHWALLARDSGHQLSLENFSPQVRSLMELYEIEDLLLARGENTAPLPLGN